MSTFTSEPGTRLGGRYRLEDRVAAAGGWAAWKAIDETLARPVTVLTFAPAFPRLREVVTAARAASRLSDVRFAQVFDVEDDWDHAYIVAEWAGGETLDDLVASGPLDAGRGGRIVAEAAAAISVAHAAGLAHLCLVPSSVRWTPGGGVKITGLGINAALSGASAEDPALADTERLGMLLYAALTGCWPGPDCPTLPPAPEADGILRSPRQVRAGIPAALDRIASRALQLHDSGDGSPITSPAELSAALLAAVPPEEIPQAPPRTRADSYRQARRPEPDPDYWSPDDQDDRDYGSPDSGGPRTYGVPPARGGPQRTRAIVIALAAVVVLAGVVFGAVHLLGGNGGAPTAGHTKPPSSPTTAASTSVLVPVSAQALDETNTDVNDALGNNPSTPWQTQFYLNNPAFGGLKSGAGLILNMGHAVRLSSVTVTFGPEPGASVQIKLGTPAGPVPPASSSPATGQAWANSLSTVSEQNDVAAGSVTFSVNSQDTGQYVVIWFTKLPPMQGQPNSFQADISNIVVKGSS
jgi:serine/threonine protein kinase